MSCISNINYLNPSNKEDSIHRIYLSLNISCRNLCYICGNFFRLSNTLHSIISNIFSCLIICTNCNPKDKFGMSILFITAPFYYINKLLILLLFIIYFIIRLRIHKLDCLLDTKDFHFYKIYNSQINYHFLNSSTIKLRDNFLNFHKIIEFFSLLFLFLHNFLNN